MRITSHSLKAPEVFGRDITIRVALPDAYDEKEPLPLMLMHDAQNFFDLWEGDETKSGALPMLDRLFKEGLRPFALAGIDTWKDRTRLDRFTDYSPWRSSDLLRYIPSWTEVETDAAGGRGEAYAEFVTQTILPFIEGRYPVGGSAALRGIGGSSMAAMASIYIGGQYPGLFSRFAFLSPALWCFEKEFTRYVQNIPPFKKGDRVYMDIGRKESSDPAVEDFPKMYLEGAQLIYNALGAKAPNIMFYIDEEGEHSIPSICRRLPMAFRYLWS